MVEIREELFLRVEILLSDQGAKNREGRRGIRVSGVYIYTVAYVWMDSSILMYNCKTSRSGQTLLHTW